MPRKKQDEIEIAFMELPEAPLPVVDNTNGHNGAEGGSGKPPGLEDVFMGPGRGKTPDLAAELLLGSEARNELLARTRFGEKEILAIVRQTARQHRLLYGWTNFDDSVQLLATLKILQDGMSRREYVAVRTGSPVSAFSQVRQGVRGAIKRYRTMDKAEVEA